MRTSRQLLCVAFAINSLLLIAPGCSQRKGQAAAAAQTRDSVVTDSASSGPPQGSAVALSYEERQGKILFLKYCAVCHGTEGKGDGFNAFNLDPRPRDLSDKQYMSAFTQERLYQTIDLGGRGINKSPSMPSWGGRLSRQEIRYVEAFVESLSARH